MPSPHGEGFAIKDLDWVWEGCPPHQPSPPPARLPPLPPRDSPRIQPALLPSRGLPGTAPGDWSAILLQPCLTPPPPPHPPPPTAEAAKESEINLQGQDMQLKKNRTRSISFVGRTLLVTLWFVIFIQLGSDRVTL